MKFSMIPVCINTIDKIKVVNRSATFLFVISLIQGIHELPQNPVENKYMIRNHAEMRRYVDLPLRS